MKKEPFIFSFLSWAAGAFILRIRVLTKISSNVCSENMSAAPFSIDGNAVRWGVGLGSTSLTPDDRLWSGLTDSYANVAMGMTAENLAEKYGITREVSVRARAPNHVFPLD